MQTIWVIFSIDEKNVFPNFIPIGIYALKEKAEKQIKELPKNQHYQLFEFPVDRFIGEITDEGKNQE